MGVIFVIVYIALIKNKIITEASSQKFTTDEEQECTEIAKTCIIDCHLENLILESKFLRLESLHELLKVRSILNLHKLLLVFSFVWFFLLC